MGTGPSRQAGGCEDDAQSHHEHRVHKIMPDTEIFHITKLFYTNINFISHLDRLLYCQL